MFRSEPILHDLARARLIDELARAARCDRNVTSDRGSRVHPFAGAAYSTPRQHWRRLTREMAADFGPLGVRVKPSRLVKIDTAIALPGTDKIVETIPLRDWVRPKKLQRRFTICARNNRVTVTGPAHIKNAGQHV